MENIDHNLSMENRERLSITGVIEVINFNEYEIIIETSLGMMNIKGEELHINKLDLEDNELEIDGNVSLIEYIDSNYSKSNSSIFSKLFK